MGDARPLDATGGGRLMGANRTASCVLLVVSAGVDCAGPSGGSRESPARRGRSGQRERRGRPSADRPLDAGPDPGFRRACRIHRRGEVPSADPRVRALHRPRLRVRARSVRRHPDDGVRQEDGCPGRQSRGLPDGLLRQPENREVRRILDHLASLSHGGGRPELLIYASIITPKHGGWRPGKTVAALALESRHHMIGLEFV